MSRFFLPQLPQPPQLPQLQRRWDIYLIGSPLTSDQWIIDGFGCMETLWLRLDEADTLVFVDLPLYVHGWWVTKRFITGYFKPPAGWPENSPILKSSLNSYRVLWLCHKYLTPRYRDYIKQAQSTKSVYHICSTKQISQFFEFIENQTNC